MLSIYICGPTLEGVMVGSDMRLMAACLNVGMNMAMLKWK